MAKMHTISIFARPARQRILHNLRADPPVSVALAGGALLGKSTLLAHLAEELSGSGGHSVVLVDCAQSRLGAQPPGPPETGGCWSVFVDNWDVIAGWPDEDRRRWAEWIGASQPGRGLLLACRHPLHEAAVALGFGSPLPHIQQTFLGLIDGAEAGRVVQAALAAYPESGGLGPALVEWCGGHPFLLDRVGDLLADVAALLPGGQGPGQAHLPLLRLRLAAAYGRPLFDSQWRAVGCGGESADESRLPLLRQLLLRPIRFDEVTPAQAEPMNWLLVQGLVGVDSHSYRLYSPLFQEFLALKLQVDVAAAPRSVADAGAVQALIEREAYRFTPQEKSLLLYFLERPGEIVSVEELLAQVWQRPDGSVRRVQEGIRRLRHRLAEFNGAVGTIDNEWGQGYRYVPIGATG